MRYFCSTIFFMRFTWFKIVAMVLLLSTIIAAYYVPVPALPMIKESIRNLYFHVCMWMVMATMQIFSVVYAVKNLYKNNLNFDAKSHAFALTATVFGLFGYATGFIWASYTWTMKTNEPVFDLGIFREPKLIGAGICLLVYFGYLVFRNSIIEPLQRAKLSSVYNIFAFAIMIPSIYVVPNLYESLHPGGQGSPVFGKSDLSGTMRLVFWPAVFGYCCLAYWVSSLVFRINIIKNKLYLK